MDVRYEYTKSTNKLTQRWKSFPCAVLVLLWTILASNRDCAFFSICTLARSITWYTRNSIGNAGISVEEETPWRRRILARYASAWHHQNRSSHGRMAK